MERNSGTLLSGIVYSLSGRRLMTDFFTHIYGLLREGGGTVLIILYSGILCFWWYLIVSSLAVVRFISFIVRLLRKRIVVYRNKKINR